MGADARKGRRSGRLARALALAALALALETFGATGAWAQTADYIWRNVRVGGGGFSPNLVFSRAEPGLAYLRTDIGGAYRFDTAANAWIPLQDQIAEPNLLGVESIAPDPLDPDIVYLAAGMYRRDSAAIMRSSDRGASWDIFPVAFRMGGNEDGRGLGERLAVDPNATSILYFGSRHDGLRRSTDRGRTWSRVRSFPAAGRGIPAPGQRTNAGIAFVLFDTASGAPGAASRTIFVGVADPGEHHLFRSDDAGASWRAVPGEPRPDLLPVRAELDAEGLLYIAYSNGVGPNRIADGAVFKHDARSGEWRDITPERGRDRHPGGYMGLSIDHQRPGVIVVATMNRWHPHDTIWRSADGGRTWRDLHPLSVRDVRDTPFLLWGQTQADFGWWIAGLAIDPFDSNRVAYTTGATVYLCELCSLADAGSVLAWRAWTQGVEETAAIALASGAAGPHLLSGFGDISGFAHEDLAVSPSLQFIDPVFANTNTIDIAGRAPNVVVRSGTPPHRASGREPTLAYSLDHGRTWTALRAPALRGTNARGEIEERRYDLTGDAAIVTSADGGTFMFMSPIPLITRDRGRTWAPARGLPAFARAIADRVDPQRFYAIDFDAGALYRSEDGGATFARIGGAGLPLNLRADRPATREHAFPLMATPDRAGDLWFVSQGRLFRSEDGGQSFGEVRSDVAVEMLAFGKAPAGSDHPTLFAIGHSASVRAIWRSDDRGAHWVRLNDSRHEYGRRFRSIAGDPRVFGRVYVGADGRGIVYGEPRA